MLPLVCIITFYCPPAGEHACFPFLFERWLKFWLLRCKWSLDTTGLSFTYIAGDFSLVDVFYGMQVAGEPRCDYCSVKLGIADRGLILVYGGISSVPESAFGR